MAMKIGCLIAQLVLKKAITDAEFISNSEETQSLTRKIKERKGTQIQVKISISLIQRTKGQECLLGHKVQQMSERNS